MRFLGNLAAVQGYSVSLSCSHCDAYWEGCAAESCCPECGRMKGYHEDDKDKCYCPDCSPELFTNEGDSIPFEIET